jgi:alkylation response protein AidB-like acyl-CoA dehydrogenase
MVAQNALAESGEQKELREAVRRLLRDKAPLTGLREAADAAPDKGGPGFDRDLWGRLAEMGLVALTVPEKYDGLGQTTLETAVVFDEMGRGLYHGPYLSCVGLAIPALLASGDAGACEEMLPGIGAGETIATLAVGDADGGWDVAATATEAAADGDGWRLTGTKAAVLDGADADLLLVTARSGDDVSLFAVSGDAAGLTRTPLESLDLARSLARVELDGTPARLVGAVGAAAPVVAEALNHGLAALAAEQAGGSAACLELCVEYAKTRHQFGKPIGSFQAVAHKCVEMLHGVEFSQAGARYAAAALAEGARDAAEAAHVAAAYNGETFRAIAVETVQVHGGTGFTWEHDTHLYYRRAYSAQQLLGSADEHFQAVADIALG